MLTALDWSIVAALLVITIALGIVVGRHQHSSRDFLLGARDLPWWTVGLSIVATETSALTFIGVPALAFGRLSWSAAGGYAVHGGDLRFMQIVAGYVIARAIIAWRIVPAYFRGEVYTPYELLGRVYGRAVRRLSGCFALFSMTLQAGVRVYVTAIPLLVVLRPAITGWSLWHAMIALVIATLPFTVFGGIRAVVWTDMLHFFVFIASGLFALLYIPTQVHSGDASGWTAIARLAGDKLELWSWGIPAREAGQPWSAWLGASIAQLFGGEFNIWMGLVGATVGVMVSHGADQLNVQRVLACRSAADGRRALLLSALIIAPQFLVFLLVGVSLYAFYAARGFAFGVPPWDPQTGRGKPKADYVFPIFIAEHVPTGVRGLMLAGVLAAAVSSLSSALTAIASVATVDLRRAGAGPRTRPSLISVRLATLAAGAVLAAVAWWAKDAPLAFNTVFRFAGIFSGAKLGAVLLATGGRRRASGAVLAAMGASAVAMAALVIGRDALPVAIRWPWLPAIGTALCLATASIWPRPPR